MELEEYRKDYLETVKMLASAESDGTVSTFVNKVLTDLQDLNVITDYELCYSVGKYGRKSYRIDAYSFDEYDCSMSIFIADFDGDNELKTITKTDAKFLFEKLSVLVDGCLHGHLCHELEISTPVYDLADKIINLNGIIRKYRLFIITDKEMSEKISTFSQSEIEGISVEYNIWDIQRLFRIMSTGDDHEPVEIDFTDFTSKGLPCLEASDVSTDDIQCFLCVIPGGVLADLYDTYGSRLLEGNIRSFLAFKGKVNKSIRKTIIGADGEDKRMFFSYNNGISATATSVTIDEESNGKYIKSINNLQIVNGGQTTASLSNVRFKDKVDLNGIFVQMKLTVIPNHEQAQLLIPKISRGSNNQNKVSDADFFSNHEFNIRLQQISRRVYAPAVNGLQYETHWFFERTRGQYEQEQSKMSKSEKKKYQMQNPKAQKITKTEFAKYQNAWMEFPFFASMGAQKNFGKFANLIVDEWNKDDVQFNEQYFKDAIAVAILFQCIDGMVPKQNWYEKGYKANIVLYTLSYLHYLIRTQFKDCELDMRLIWDKQQVPDVISDEFVKMTKFVFDYITDEERPIKNVTEWCKKEQCWIELKSKNYSLNDEIRKVLITKDELKKKRMDNRKHQKVISGIQVQAEVVEKGQDYWLKALKWGRDKGVLTEVDSSFLLSATKLDFGRILSEKQCQRIVNIEAKLLDEGFAGE